MCESKNSTGIKLPSDPGPANSQDLWTHSTEIDNARIDLDRIQHVLLTLEEQLEREVDVLKKQEDFSGRYFSSRYDMHRSLLEIAELSIQRISEQLKQIADKIRQNRASKEGW